MRSFPVAAAVLGLSLVAHCAPTAVDTISNVEQRPQDGPLLSATLARPHTHLSKRSGPYNARLPAFGRATAPIQTFTFTFADAPSEMIATPSSDLEHDYLYRYILQSTVPIVEFFVATYDPDTDSWVQGHTNKPGMTLTASLKLTTLYSRITPHRVVAVFAQPGATARITLRMFDRLGLVMRGDEVDVTGKEYRGSIFADPLPNHDSSPFLRPSPSGGTERVYPGVVSASWQRLAEQAVPQGQAQARPPPAGQAAQGATSSAPSWLPSWLRPGGSQQSSTPPSDLANPLLGG